jgi:hypothetical protein
MRTLGPTQKGRKTREGSGMEQGLSRAARLQIPEVNFPPKSRPWRGRYKQGDIYTRETRLAAARKPPCVERLKKDPTQRGTTKDTEILRQRVERPGATQSSKTRGVSSE